MTFSQKLRAFGRTLGWYRSIRYFWEKILPTGLSIYSSAVIGHYLLRYMFKVKLEHPVEYYGFLPPYHFYADVNPIALTAWWLGLGFGATCVAIFLAAVALLALSVVIMIPVGTIKAIIQSKFVQDAVRQYNYNLTNIAAEDKRLVEKREKMVKQGGQITMATKQVELGQLDSAPQIKSTFQIAREMDEEKKREREDSKPRTNCSESLSPSIRRERREQKK